MSAGYTISMTDTAPGHGAANQHQSTVLSVQAAVTQLGASMQFTPPSQMLRRTSVAARTRSTSEWRWSHESMNACSATHDSAAAANSSSLRTEQAPFDWGLSVAGFSKLHLQYIMVTYARSRPMLGLPMKRIGTIPVRPQDT